MAAGAFGATGRTTASTGSNVPALGLVEVCLVQGLAGTIWWCPAGALLVQSPDTTLRLMFLTEGVRCS
jgi:hypothetical protein